MVNGKTEQSSTVVENQQPTLEAADRELLFGNMTASFDTPLTYPLYIGLILSSMKLNVTIADPPDALEREVSAAGQKIGTNWMLVSVQINKATYIHSYVVN